MEYQCTADSASAETPLNPTSQGTFISSTGRLIETRSVDASPVAAPSATGTGRTILDTFSSLGTSINRFAVPYSVQPTSNIVSEAEQGFSCGNLSRSQHPEGFSPLLTGHSGATAIPADPYRFAYHPLSQTADSSPKLQSRYQIHPDVYDADPSESSLNPYTDSEGPSDKSGTEILADVARRRRQNARREEIHWCNNQSKGGGAKPRNQFQSEEPKSHSEFPACEYAVKAVKGKRQPAHNDGRSSCSRSSANLFNAAARSTLNGPVKRGGRERSAEYVAKCGSAHNNRLPVPSDASDLRSLNISVKPPNSPLNPRYVSGMASGGDNTDKTSRRRRAKSPRNVTGPRRCRHRSPCGLQDYETPIRTTRPVTSVAVHGVGAPTNPWIVDVADTAGADGRSGNQTGDDVIRKLWNKFSLETEQDSTTSMRRKSSMVKSAEECRSQKSEEEPLGLWGVLKSQVILASFFVFLPLGFGSYYLKLGEGTVFLMNFLAIVPMAWLMGKATEDLACHMGQIAGGLLNAWFGNVVEMLLCVAGLRRGERVVVRSTLIGSILSNLLLVTGCSFLFGGMRHKVQEFSAIGASTNASLMTLSCMCLGLPTIYATILSSATSSELNISRTVSFFLIFIYIQYLVFQLGTHSFLFAEDDDETADLSLYTAAAVLVVCSILCSFCSDFLVASIEGVVTKFSLSKEFIGIILLPIVGNAAEHYTSVIVAMRNKMDLSLACAVGSSCQMALFVTPFCVLVGWAMDEPMSLDLHAFELLVLVMSVLIITSILQDGYSHWLEGSMLLSAYCVIAIIYFFEDAQYSEII